jgi:hypothetical protein
MKSNVIRQHSLLMQINGNISISILIESMYVCLYKAYGCYRNWMELAELATS